VKQDLAISQHQALGDRGPVEGHTARVEASHRVGAVLITDEVSPANGDLRRRAFATTDQAAALQGARQRQRHVGDTLSVYEVEVVEPEVDVNLHRRGMPAEVPSVMAEVMRVLRVVQAEPDDGVIFPG
jgi:hypothetical protein